MLRARSSTRSRARFRKNPASYHWAGWYSRWPRRRNRIAKEPEERSCFVSLSHIYTQECSPAILSVIAPARQSFHILAEGQQKRRALPARRAEQKKSSQHA